MSKFYFVSRQTTSTEDAFPNSVCRLQTTQLPCVVLQNDDFIISYLNKATMRALRALVRNNKTNNYFLSCCFHGCARFSGSTLFL